MVRARRIVERPASHPRDDVVELAAGVLVQDSTTSYGVFYEVVLRTSTSCATRSVQEIYASLGVCGRRRKYDFTTFGVCEGGLVVVVCPMYFVLARAICLHQFRWRERESIMSCMLIWQIFSCAGRRYVLGVVVHSGYLA